MSCRQTNVLGVCRHPEADSSLAAHTAQESNPRGLEAKFESPIMMNVKKRGKKSGKK